LSVRIVQFSSWSYPPPPVSFIGPGLAWKWVWCDVINWRTWYDRVSAVKGRPSCRHIRVWVGEVSFGTFSIMTLSITVKQTRAQAYKHLVLSVIMLSIIVLSGVLVLLCLVSLCWVSLCWVSLCWMSLCWVSWRRPVTELSCTILA
jgi:hypothetical protein